MADCGECRIHFSKMSNLRAHVKRKHPDKVDILAPKVRKVGDYICKKCSNSFTNFGNLREHIKRKHPEQLEELAPIKKKVFKCQRCELEFCTLKEFTVHKKVHKTVKMLKCPLCKQTYASKENIIIHFNENHSLGIVTETLGFSSFDDFQAWKAKLEKDTFASFINLHGSGKNATLKRIMYACHRSGDAKNSSANIRSLKTQGSNKINAYCPAHMNVLVQETERTKCTVTFCKTHVGHKQEEDIGHLFLSMSDKQNIAAKIAAKIPLQTILDEIRDSVSNCHLERIHLLTKKDLYNIENSFNLNKTSVRHKNDAVSVDAWVNELKVSDSILFYKPQDSVSPNYPLLKEEDFFLGIMTQGQKELLLKFGDDCICVDGTHGLNGYGFEMHTILVLDDLREGYPCAFLISNRSDAEVMKIFFSCIEEQIEKKIAPKVFMSDMAESYYNAWLQIMHPAEFKLYCTWHVDKAWRRNLDKIPNKEKKALVYQMMRMLLQERDVSSFKILLQTFLTQCREDPETTEFARYFELYANKQEQWAYCFRLHSGLNTNMHIERMHRTIKHLYLNGKFTKRLDKALTAIMKFVRDKLFTRLIVVHKGKVCTKLSDLRQRHKNSETLDINKVVQSETGWIVPSTSGKEIYLIEELQSECTCKLICTQCLVCIHRFTCSCLDNSIKWNMCKHIHLVAQFLQRNPATCSTADIFSDNLVIDNTANDKLEESTWLTKSISCNKDENQILLKEQQTILATFQQQILGTRSLEETQLIKQILAPINPTLEASRSIRTYSLREFKEYPQ